MQDRPKIPWLFYALVFYVLMQFVWWEVLLARQSKQLSEEQKKIIALNISDKNLLEGNIKQIETKHKHQLWMHVGEGTVFLVLLSLGIMKIVNARKKEIELSRLQNNFLLSVTHELKSPLAAVKLQLQTLQKRKLDADTQSELLQKALADNERLLRMIDNILLASRSKNEQPMLNKRETDLGVFVLQLVGHNFDEVRKRINVTGSAIVMADEQVLSLILSNIMENALKYSTNESAVNISIENGTIYISDFGPGISDQEKAKVLHKFYRIGNEETRNTKGTGLGLYIVKTLCDLHGMRISLEDNHPRGLRVVLRF